VATTNCVGAPGGTCEILTCVAGSGCYDVDGQYADGCECCNDANSKSCSTATPVSAGAVGNSINVTGTLPVSGLAGGDWFAVQFNTAATAVLNIAYHPKIAVTQSAGAVAGIVFNVYSDCNGALLSNCSDGAASGLTEWDESYASGGSPPLNPASLTWGKTAPLPTGPSDGLIYVVVYRATGTAKTCSDDQFTLTVSN